MIEGETYVEEAIESGKKTIVIIITTTATTIATAKLGDPQIRGRPN